MNKRKLVLVLAVLVLAGAVPAMAEISQIVKVPVSGQSNEPLLGGTITYDGVMNMIWTPEPEEGYWRVTEVLVADVLSASKGNGFLCQGFSEERVPGSPGSTVKLAPDLRVFVPGGGASFNVTREVALTVPARPRAIVASAAASEVVVVPVSGEYYEPVLGDDVAYRGGLTLVWTPSSTTSEWTVSGTLTADAVGKASGTRFVYCASCAECFTLTKGATIELTKPFWALGSGAVGGFLGTLRMVVALPEGILYPQVKAFTIASR